MSIAVVGHGLTLLQGMFERAKIFGRPEVKSGIKPFDQLVDQVMSQIPYKTAHRVFWITDNGSSHRGQPFALASPEEMAKCYCCSFTNPCQLA